MNRRTEIIQYLIEKNAVVTLKELAHVFHVSPRTVRYDLSKMEPILELAHCQIKRQQGVGIWIEGDKASYDLLLELCDDSQKAVLPFSPEDRKRYILSKMLTSTEKITLKHLSKELYVSHGTVYTDVQRVSEWLESYGIELVRRQGEGIQIKGSEGSIRRAIVGLFSLEQTGGSENEEIRGMRVYTRIDEETRQRLYKLLPLNYHKLEELLLNVEDILGFQFSDDAFMSLVLHIVIAIMRVNEGKAIDLSEAVKKELQEEEEYMVASQLCHAINLELGYFLPDNEISYLLLHILGAKNQKFHTEPLSLEFGEENNQLPAIIAKEIAIIASRALELPIQEDQVFLNGLILHLRPTIHRLTYGLTLKNPIVEEIKKNYPDVLGVAWMTSTVFQRYLNKRITEDEVAYLALHIGAAVERNRQPIHVVIVCHSGVGTSQFLAAKIRGAFREIDVDNIISSTQLQDMDMAKIDFIISTVPLGVDSIQGKSVIQVKALLMERDIQKIQKKISDLTGKKNRLSAMPSLKEKHIFIITKEGMSKEDAIRHMCHTLFMSGYVAKEFEEDVLKRENIATTCIGKGLAIPHGNPSFVYHTGFAVTYFKRPIDDHGEKISMILLIFISSKQRCLSNVLFRNLYTLVEKEDFETRLNAIENKTEIIEMLEEL